MKTIKNDKYTFTIVNIKDTTYENNSRWLQYNICENFGFEILEEYMEISDLNFIRKKNIEECSEDLKKLIKACRDSESEMLFVELDDYYYTEKKIDEIFEEVNKLRIQGLEDYFEFYQNSSKITIYGGVVTKFEFNQDEF